MERRKAAQDRLFTHAGRQWTCFERTPNMMGVEPAEMVKLLEGGLRPYWIATAENPKMRIVAASWEKLVEEIKATDPTKSRIDGVAFAHGLGVGGG